MASYRRRVAGRFLPRRRLGFDARHEGPGDEILLHEPLCFRRNLGRRRSCSRGAAGALPDLTGGWGSTASGEGSCGDSVGRFKLILTQSGKSVTGSYYGVTASLSGTLVGNGLVGTWIESDGTGSLRFIFSDDRNAFEGSWSIPGSTSMGAGPASEARSASLRADLMLTNFSARYPSRVRERVTMRVTLLRQGRCALGSPI